MSERTISKLSILDELFSLPPPVGKQYFPRSKIFFQIYIQSYKKIIGKNQAKDNSNFCNRGEKNFLEFCKNDYFCKNKVEKRGKRWASTSSYRDPRWHKSSSRVKIRIQRGRRLTRRLYRLKCRGRNSLILLVASARTIYRLHANSSSNPLLLIGSFSNI